MCLLTSAFAVFENLFFKKIFSTPTAQEVLDNLKDRWYQADNPPADLLLNEEEFLSFLHPEHSRGMLKFMVKEIIRDLGTFFKTPIVPADKMAQWLGIL